MYLVELVSTLFVDLAVISQTVYDILLSDNFSS